MRTHLPARPRRRPTRTPWRHRLRSPLLHGAAAVALGLAALLTIQSRSDAVARQARRFGPTVPAAVVVHDVAAGGLVGPGEVRVIGLPAAMAPSGALRRAPVGARARVPLVAGEVLIGSRLAGRSSALASVIPSGWRAIAVPMPDGGLRLSAGDRVDVLALGTNGTSTTIVPDAMVLASGDRAATIAVPRRDVAPVADAILAATLTLALSGA